MLQKAWEQNDTICTTHYDYVNQTMHIPIRIACSDELRYKNYQLSWSTRLIERVRREQTEKSCLLIELRHAARLITKVLLGLYKPTYVHYVQNQEIPNHYCIMMYCLYWPVHSYKEPVNNLRISIIAGLQMNRKQNLPSKNGRRK